MRRRAGGQSMVEMAFVLPVLLAVLFGIMEFGYLIFAYSTVSQATRNAAESAAQLPPFQSWLSLQGSAIPNAPDGRPLTFRSDLCVNAIYTAAESDATLFKKSIASNVTIDYPNDDILGRDTRNLEDRGPIEITIQFQVQGITPLFSLLRIGDDGMLTMTVTQRRSLENLGEDPSKPGGIACAEDPVDWQKVNKKP